MSDQLNQSDAAVQTVSDSIQAERHPISECEFATETRLYGSASIDFKICTQHSNFAELPKSVRYFSRKEINHQTKRERRVFVCYIHNTDTNAVYFQSCIFNEDVNHKWNNSLKWNHIHTALTRFFKKPYVGKMIPYEEKTDTERTDEEEKNIKKQSKTEYYRDQVRAMMYNPKHIHDLIKNGPTAGTYTQAGPRIQ